MVRTQIYLTKREHERLRRLVARIRSQSELIWRRWISGLHIKGPRAVSKSSKKSPASGGNARTYPILARFGTRPTVSAVLVWRRRETQRQCRRFLSCS
jgi:hypothetical protein